MFRDEILVAARGRGTYDLTAEVSALVQQSGVQTGMCHLFIRHTSASLMLCENADPDVMRDLESFMSRLAPDGDPMYAHVDEGPDDMPAHIRSILTQSDLNLPVENGQCMLGTWQGIYLWEHRHASYQRHVVVSIVGT